MRHLTDPTDITRKETDDIVALALDIIANRAKYSEVCKGKKLATLFYEPSTRTRLSFTSAMTYDYEVWSAAQELWLEVSSVSNFETFQANRMKLRFKDKDGNIRLVHTLNGSALALPRIVAALLENNQCEEGIRVPKALQKYTGFEIIK